VGVLNVLGAIAGGIASIFGFEAVEEPAYTVLHRSDLIEVRRYEPYVVASVEGKPGFRESQNAAFRRLASYIFGDNRAQRELAMTAPVTMAPTATRLEMTAPVLMTANAQTWQMSFVLPRGVTLQNAPVPLDQGIQLTEIPTHEVSVIRFSGGFDEHACREQESVLRTWLTQSAWEAIAPARYAGYNPPFTLPFLKRNEVLIPVKSRR